MLPRVAHAGVHIYLPLGLCLSVIQACHFMVKKVSESVVGTPSFPCKIGRMKIMLSWINIRICPGNVNRIYHNRIFNKVSMMFDPIIFMGPIAIATAIWYLPWQMAMTRLAYACKAELGLV